MMRGNAIQFTTVVPRQKLLDTLRANRAGHGRIVAEAKRGYVEQARQALEERLRQLAAGEIASLLFSLSPPQDYTKTYDNAIQMLEWDTRELVELEAQDFRNLVQDDWSWSDDFLASNARYSASATAELAKKKG